MTNKGVLQLKKLKVGIIALTATVLLAACGSGSSEETSASEDKVITIGGSVDGYPQYYMENDELKGFSVDTAEAIAAEAGYELEWEMGEWTGLLASLQTGKIDTMSNFANTPERAETYAFTDTYAYSRTGVAVAPDNTDIQNFDDLKGKTVNGIVGSNYDTVLKENDPNDEITIESIEDMNVAFSNVQAGKTDGFVQGYETLLAQVNNKGIDLRVLDDPFGEKSVGFPFHDTEENQQVISDFNEAIATLQADGTLAAISEEWFGLDITTSNE